MYDVDCAPFVVGRTVQPSSSGLPFPACSTLERRLLSRQQAAQAAQLRMAGVHHADGPARQSSNTLNRKSCAHGVKQAAAPAVMAGVQGPASAKLHTLTALRESHLLQACLVHELPCCLANKICQAALLYIARVHTAEAAWQSYNKQYRGLATMA